MSEQAHTVESVAPAVPPAEPAAAATPSEIDAPSPDSTARAAPQDRSSAGGAVGLWWAGLTVAAVAATYLLHNLETAHGAALAAVWATHNLVGWSITLRAIRHARRRSTAGRLTIETWLVAMAAAWAIVASAVWSTALAEWATLTVIQLVVGVSLAATGAAVRDGTTTVCGLVCITSAPMLLALGEGAHPGAWSLALMAVATGISIISVGVGWRRMRIAALREQA